MYSPSWVCHLLVLPSSGGQSQWWSWYCLIVPPRGQPCVSGTFSQLNSHQETPPVHKEIAKQPQRAVNTSNTTSTMTADFEIMVPLAIGVNALCY